MSRESEPPSGDEGLNIPEIPNQGEFYMNRFQRLLRRLSFVNSPGGEAFSAEEGIISHKQRKILIGTAIVSTLAILAVLGYKKIALDEYKKFKPNKPGQE